MIKIFDNLKLGRYREESLGFSLSAFEAFKRIYPYSQNMFLLESLGEAGAYNRFAYAGFDPLFIIEGKVGELRVNGRSYQTNDPFMELKPLAAKNTLRDGFCGGLVGFICYEATKLFEKAFKGPDCDDFPLFSFGFYTDGLKFDKRTREVTYFHHGNSRIRELRSLLDRSGTLSQFSYKKTGKGKSQKEYQENLHKIQEHIRSGDIFQAVYSLKTRYHIKGDKRRLYGVLRQINPAPYMSYLKFEDKEIISASPELLINIKSNSIEHYGTLAGTIKRGKNEKEDRILAKEILSDEKEKAEHLMLVDLARNDLGKICKFKSIRVGKLMAVKKLKFVMHLFTEIRGQLRGGEDAFSALSACFPAGTLTGAPKIEAMKIISDMENEARGPYGGVIGYISLNKSSMFAISIRSIFIKGEHGFTRTGSGIVLDSKAEKEFEEIKNKQKGMEEALKSASILSF